MERVSITTGEIFERFMRKAKAFLASGESAHVSRLAAFDAVCADGEEIHNKARELLLQQAFKDRGLFDDLAVEDAIETGGGSGAR